MAAAPQAYQVATQEFQKLQQRPFLTSSATHLDADLEGILA
jgi:hypothetical protein